MNDKLTHKGYILKALLLFIVIVHSAVSTACKCPPVTPISKELAKNYELIFTGKIDSVAACATNGVARAFFTIEELYKGNAKQQVEVHFDCASSCMMSFAKNEEWLIYANYQRFDVAMVKLCSQSRKQFKASEQDFYLAAAQRTFEQEKEFLKTELGIQPFIKTEKWNNDQQEYKPHNEQPSGMNKIYLLLVSFAVMILIYIITRKNKKKNG